MIMIRLSFKKDGSSSDIEELTTSNSAEPGNKSINPTFIDLAKYNDEPHSILLLNLQKVQFIISGYRGKSLSHLCLQIVRGLYI